jgi:hypothetical protein
MKRNQVQLYHKEKSRQKLLSHYPAQYPGVNQAALIKTIEQLTQSLAFLFGRPVDSVMQYIDTLRHMTNPEVSIQLLELVWEKRRKDYYAEEEDFLRRHSLDNLTRAQRDFRRMFDMDASYYQEKFPTLSEEEIVPLSQAMKKILLAHTQELLTMLEPLERSESKERAPVDPLAAKFRELKSALKERASPLGQPKHVTWAEGAAEDEQDNQRRGGPANF